MSVSRSFLAYALELLAPLGDVSARAMFGGYGLYKDGRMFALLDDDELFLKTDDVTLPRFLEAGCRQWVYPSPKGPMPTSSYGPPPDAMEDADAMLPWARLAVEAAARAAAKKGARKPGAKKTPAKKVSAKKAPAKKVSAKKAPAKKVSSKRPAAKKPARSR